ncbi:hypothetical protein SAMN05421788_101574 [Filimonas lacunae]|uniref:Uncharacterized protein n=1 Tax=Filimonas lacunae TaxID=477680 RepID=A0A1N7L1I7_9BACT|nr:hypothetical protein SAMN05421788_101574 [Filimonas lacunae]
MSKSHTGKGIFSFVHFSEQHHIVFIDNTILNNILFFYNRLFAARQINE